MLTAVAAVSIAVVACHLKAASGQVPIRWTKQETLQIVGRVFFAVYFAATLPFLHSTYVIFRHYFN